MKKDKIDKIVDNIIARHEKEELKEKGTNNIFRYNAECFINSKGIAMLIAMGSFLIIILFGERYFLITIPFTVVFGCYLSWKYIDERYTFRKK